MNADVKAKWVTELRLGVLSQGRSRLASRRYGEPEFEYCCLGVLCEIAVKEGVIAPPRFGSYSGLNGELHPAPEGRLFYDDEQHALPYAVMEWADLERHGNQNGYEGSLADMNDGTNTNRHSFEQIADYIEEYL